MHYGKFQNRNRPAGGSEMESLTRNYLFFTVLLFNFYCIILDELFGVILNIGFLCNFCKTHPFDMVVGVD